MLREGTIGVPDEGATLEKGHYTICHYRVKHYKNRSRYGIDGGRISELQVRIDGKITASYDRGWETEPADRASEIAVAILMYEHN